MSGEPDGHDEDGEVPLDAEDSTDRVRESVDADVPAEPRAAGDAEGIPDDDVSFIDALREELAGPVGDDEDGADLKQDATDLAGRFLRRPLMPNLGAAAAALTGGAFWKPFLQLPNLRLATSFGAMAHLADLGLKMRPVVPPTSIGQLGQMGEKMRALPSPTSGFAQPAGQMSVLQAAFVSSAFADVLRGMSTVVVQQPGLRDAVAGLTGLSERLTGLGRLTEPAWTLQMPQIAALGNVVPPLLRVQADAEEAFALAFAQTPGVEVGPEKAALREEMRGMREALAEATLAIRSLAAATVGADATQPQPWARSDRLAVVGILLTVITWIASAAGVQIPGGALVGAAAALVRWAQELVQALAELAQQ